MINSTEEGVLAQDIAAWEAHLLRKWRLPERAFAQGHVSYHRSNDTRAVWRPGGGVVSCQDTGLGADLAAALRLSDCVHSHDTLRRIGNVFSRRGMAGSWLVDCSLLWRRSSGPLPCVSAENIRFIDRTSNEIGAGLPEEVEHVLAILRDAAVASWVSNIPVLKVRDHWIHALRVETIPGWRRQGLAKRVVSAMLDHLASEKATALWVCKATNVASLHLARSLGFVHHFCTLNWSVR